MRKIAVVTGTRAEYGPLKPLMNAIENDPALKLFPLITGMHLLPDYGNTYKLVEKDFPRSVKIPMPLNGDSLTDMALYLSSGIKNFALYLTKNPPDIIVITADRSEQLAAALAALYLNIPIAHINGGDVSGGMIDESIRHAITKIAHIHLAHNKKNAERIKKMGEDGWRIHVTGALAIQAIKEIKIKSKKELFKTYHLNPDIRTFLVVQHPITTLNDRGYEQFRELLTALDTLQEQTILIYPNCDAGSRKFITLLEKYENRPYLHIFKNVPHDDYISFMKYVDLMLGNSSSGIIEAPTLKTPVINIGDRQQGREISDNIKTIKPEKVKKEEILSKIHFVLTDADFNNKVKHCKNKFGEGNASKKIIKILKTIKIDEKLIRKQITY
jgi:UDP-N-acetylglucosamine 2-epimerase (non-hydrolysing)/GDP/UDP-N,N'-diacetylbacillosamine 2-epimerase (hydrolysing)